MAGAPACFYGALMYPWLPNSFRRLSTCHRYRLPLLPAISLVSPPSVAVCSSSTEITVRPDLRAAPHHPADYPTSNPEYIRKMFGSGRSFAEYVIFNVLSIIKCNVAIV